MQTAARSVYLCAGHSEHNSGVLEPEQVEHYLGSIEEIQSAVRNGPAHAMTGVEADGTLVGFYVLHPDRRDNSCWWLGWFALDRRYQGRGYGHMAMAQIMTNVRHIVGCRRVRLLVSPRQRPCDAPLCAGGIPSGRQAHHRGAHPRGSSVPLRRDRGHHRVVARFIGVEARAPRGSPALVARPPCGTGHRHRAWPAQRARAAAHRLVEEAPCGLTVRWRTARPFLRLRSKFAASTCFDRSSRRSASAGC
jgi:GNAT superfamily N-acetyltransferase